MLIWENKRKREVVLCGKWRIGGIILDEKCERCNDAKMIISQALENGWTPKEKGKPIVFDLVGDSIIKR